MKSQLTVNTTKLLLGINDRATDTENIHKIFTLVIQPKQSNLSTTMNLP